MTDILAQLRLLSEEPYRRFQSRLMPTVAPDRVLGVRTPALRRLAKELAGTSVAEAFMQELPHNYFEENMLHAFLIERVEGYDSCMAALERFLPFVDNWATCDGLSPKAFCSHPSALPAQIRCWLDSGWEFTVRFGICMLMKHFLDEAFLPEYAEWVASLAEEDYYIRMGVAWYFATALAKQPAAVWPILEQHRLPVWTHNKTVQKALESLRFSPADKERLRTMRRTNKTDG